MSEMRFYDLFKNKIENNKSKLLFQKRDGWSWKQITWLDFETEVKSIASFLLDIGFKKGERILVVASNSLECLNVELATFLLGGCTVPVSNIHDISNLDHILETENIRFAVLENEEVLSKAADKLESNGGIEKIFTLSDYKSGIEDNVINYRTLVKFGFLKLKKLKDELEEYCSGVEPDTPCISFYDFSDDNPRNKILTQELFLEILQHAYRKMRFVTPDDQSFSYLTASSSFAKMANYLTIFIGSRGAIAENKKDFFSDVLEVMPTVMFLTKEGMEKSVEYLASTNGSLSLKKSLGGRLKYVFTDSEPGYSVKNSFIVSGISIIELPELASISS